MQQWRSYFDSTSLLFWINISNVWGIVCLLVTYVWCAHLFPHCVRNVSYSIDRVIHFVLCIFLVLSLSFFHSLLSFLLAVIVIVFYLVWLAIFFYLSFPFTFVSVSSFCSLSSVMCWTYTHTKWNIITNGTTNDNGGSNNTNRINVWRW